MAAAVAIAALALFFLPALLGFGSPEGPAATPSPTPAPSRSIAPTPTAAPTPTTYVIKAGDTLSKIATEYGLTLDELLAANPDITDPNRITEGQQIIIPAPTPEPGVIGPSAAPSGSAAP
jgi:LysM repeat protein